MKKRTPLSKRDFPGYTRGEEIFNMVSHIAGAAMAIPILVICLVISATHNNPWAVVSSAIYGSMMIIMFTISSIYHGLYKNLGKQVLRIIDHCDIYFFIAGTYMPFLLVAIRPEHPVLAWTVFGIEWAAAAVAVVLNAIDLEKFKVFSYICYLVMGWGIVFCSRYVIETISLLGFLWLLAGGISFTIGAILYAAGAKKKYLHSVFHLFVNAGCFLMFISLANYVL